jgi:hypothetical protein
MIAESGWYHYITSIRQQLISLSERWQVLEHLAVQLPLMSRLLLNAARVTKGCDAAQQLPLQEAVTILYNNLARLSHNCHLALLQLVSTTAFTH